MATYSFSANVRAFARRTRLRQSVVLQVLSLNALELLMAYSPVDTGRFRASWRLAIGTPDLSVAPPQPRSEPKEPGSFAPVTYPNAFELFPQGRLDAIEWGQTIYITNNLPYAQPLEDGWSRQRPSPPGILRAAASELVESIEVAIMRAKEP